MARELLRKLASRMHMSGAQGDMARFADIITEVCDEDEREEREREDLEQAAFDKAIAKDRY